MNWSRTGKWLTTIAAALTLAACGNGGGDTTTEETTADNGGEAAGDFDTSATINVITREDGSGTRGAFTEITGILVEEGDTEIDNTYAGATIQNSTNGVLQAVAGDTNAIGYASTGSVDDSVKAVMVDGAEASQEAIQAGDYPIQRPFNVAYSGELSPEAQDFWNFIFSQEGQDIVTEEGYIGKTDAEAYTADDSVSGNVSVVGSTSVTPVMEKLKEAYEANSDVTIDITSNGSSAGMTAAIDGSADIGMASRELSDEEAGALTAEALAIDGIAVIVNNENPLDDISLDDVRAVFTGEKTTWDELGQ